MIAKERGAFEAGLALEVVDDDRTLRVQREPCMGVVIGGDGRRADQLLRQAGRRPEDELISPRHQLEHLGVLDVEGLGRCLHRLSDQNVQPDLLGRVATEVGDRRLLLGAGPELGLVVYAAADVADHGDAEPLAVVVLVDADADLHRDLGPVLAP